MEIRFHIIIDAADVTDAEADGLAIEEELREWLEEFATMSAYKIRSPIQVVLDYDDDS